MDELLFSLLLMAIAPPSIPPPVAEAAGRAIRQAVPG
jgi:hypothetical protein